MPSKRSFFNPTLFRKNLSRFWPLWGGVSLVGAMAPLYILLSLLSDRHITVNAFEFSGMLYNMVTMFVPAFTMGYAILCAMAVWSYLYNVRSVGLMHTLPVDRTCLFVTGAVSGLAMMLIPYVVVGGLICLIALGWGFFSLTAVVQTAAAVILLSLQFFGFATLCAMVTGNLFALPVFYLLFNFLAPMTEALVVSLAESFLVGVVQSSGGVSYVLSPILQIYNSFSCESDYQLQTVRLTGTGVVAAYGLVGLVMLLGAWLLYRGRKSESAGDVVSFRGLRPVFRYGLALFSSLTLGRLLYEVIWAALFQRGSYADVLPMAVCMALTGVLGYYVASMLLEKSLRVFQGSWPGVLAVCAASAVICLCVSLDVFGLESRLPDPEDVERVTLSDYLSDVQLDYTAAQSPEMAARILALHQAITADLDYIKACDRGEVLLDGGGAQVSVAQHPVKIVYYLKNGSTLSRFYRDLPVSSSRAEESSTYDALLSELYTDPAVIKERVSIPDGSRLSEIYVSGNVEDIKQSAIDEEVLYEALLQDAGEGNIPAYDLFSFDQEEVYNIYLEIEYQTWSEGGFSHNWKGIYLYPTMSHTAQALLDMGVIPLETLTGPAG